MDDEIGVVTIELHFLCRAIIILEVVRAEDKLVLDKVGLTIAI